MCLTNTVKLLQQFAKNGVVRLTDVAGGNYPLFKFVQKNKFQVKESLESAGLELFDDLRGKRGYDKVRLYLKYHFGDVVDLSEVRKTHRTAYNYLLELGEPYQALSDMGFEISYKARSTEEKLQEQVQDLASGPIPPQLYQKLYYRAKRNGMTVSQYIEFLQSKGEG